MVWQLTPPAPLHHQPRIRSSGELAVELPGLAGIDAFGRPFLLRATLLEARRQVPPETSDVYSSGGR